MHKDVSQARRIKRRRCYRRYFRAALLSLIACLPPVAQTAHAVDIYYAGAIGQDFLPEPNARNTTDASSAQAQPKPQPTQAQTGAPELPALGGRAEEGAVGAGMGLWTKVLIGVVVVGAMAALSSKGGGGGGEATVDTGSPPNAGGSNSPPPSSSAPPAGSPPPSAPAPTPGPIAVPAPPQPGGGDRDDDRGRNRGRR